MKRNGFTLVELLVVIAIIGIMSTMVLVSLQGARLKARDSRRESDIRQIMTAMILDYDDHEKYYQNSGSPPDKIPCSNTNCNATGDGRYLNSLPKDPKTSSKYGWINNTADDQRYCIFAELESPSIGSEKYYFLATERGTKKMSTSTLPQNFTLNSCD